jgi:putative (di)nucleoside polyphosphate hydrolase
MNSIIVGVILALWFGNGWGWLFISLIFLFTFILQVVVAKNDRQKKDEPKEASRAQTFRAGVGAIILNEGGKVLALERKDIPGAWQLPQGGLEDESPLEAVMREIREETGIEPQQLELLSTGPRLLAYELPLEARSKKTGRGQVQYWFLFQFTGPDEAITLGDHKEFRDWKWMSMDRLAAKVVSFKQPVYQELARDFKSYWG